MSSHCYRFQFAEGVVRDDVETAFLLTLTAVESLHGDAATRLNGRHAFDAEGLGVVIDAGTPDGRGVVAAANYVVRKFGVHSAMPTATALRLCPEAIVVRPRMEHYAAVSEQIRHVFDRYTPLVEPLSLDEAFLDVTGTEGLFGPAEQLARRIKQDVLREVGLIASVGVAPNKFLAKIASDLEKPDSLVVVDPDRIQAFLDPLPVGRLWGVGRVAGSTFETLGIRTIADLRQRGPELLRQHFGAQGERFWELAHGRDERPVISDREAKSISHESTFAADLSDPEALRAWLLELTEHVGRRLRRSRRSGRTVEIKVRFADFRTTTRSRSLRSPTSTTQEIWEVAAELLNRCLATRRMAVRLLGVGMSGLERATQAARSLFDDSDEWKHEALDAAADAIHQKFGATALSRGSGLLHNAKHRPEPRPNQTDNHAES